MMVEYIQKEVKKYSGRLRVNIVKDDDLTQGQKIVILKENDFNKLLSDYGNLEDQVKKLENERTNIDNLIENVLNPIYQKHNKELENKDNQIKQKDTQLDNIKALCSNYNTRMNGLSLMDMVVRKKHKKIISEFEDKIWIHKKRDYITDVDMLPASKDKT